MTSTSPFGESSFPLWTVGFDDERVGTFDNERAALDFAHFDSQLEGVTAVVVRHDADGTMTVIAEFVR